MNAPAAALLLIDLQRDFLSDPALVPEPECVTARASALLRGFRGAGLPVCHAHVRIRADGTDRMPHQIARDLWRCVDGSPGARPPDGLEPRAGEQVVLKSVFSAFAQSDLGERLRSRGVELLVLAGVHLQTCVAKSALDAYERGFRVWVASDAVASYDPLQALLSERHLTARSIEFFPVEEILERVGAVPVRSEPETWEHRNPARRDELLRRVPIAPRSEVAEAVRRSVRARSAVAALRLEERLERLRDFGDALARSTGLDRLISGSVGKPIVEARAEVRRAIELVEAAARNARGELAKGPSGDAVRVVRAPVGVVALITPWNNPLSIPVSKLAAALAFGNSVVWKPALPGWGVARAVEQALAAAGWHPDAVRMVPGDARTALDLIAQQEIDAVTLTGGALAGRSAALFAAQSLKPFQAELGGNNAALVMPSADVVGAARALARCCFGFAGQRCTATRRLLVHRAVRAEFEDAFRAAMAELVVGDPELEATEVGPVISRQAAERLEALVGRAERSVRAPLPDGLAGEGWYVAPTLVLDPPVEGEHFQVESFGPVAVLLSVAGLAEGIRLANGVRQGLVAALYSEEAGEQRAFVENIEAGVAKLNQPTCGVDLEAPFVGWKESGLGPPEHGLWDREFFSRVKAVYGRECEPVPQS